MKHKVFPYKDVEAYKALHFPVVVFSRGGCPPLFSTSAAILARNPKSLLRYGGYCVFLRIVLRKRAKIAAPCSK